MNMFWWKGLPNFGDALSPLIVEKLSGEKPVWSNGSNKLLAVGSILAWADNGDIVWGSGSFFNPANVRSKNLNVVSVRGPKTRDALLKIQVQCPERYGDPALLFPKLFGISPNPIKKLGIVPHHTDFNLTKKRFPDVFVIDPKQDPFVVLKQIAECEVILSSSLHGIICAEAMGIKSVYARLSFLPASDLTLSGKGKFKFQDYYESTYRFNVVEKCILDHSDIKSAISNVEVPPSNIINDLTIDIEKSFPKNLIQKEIK